MEAEFKTYFYFTIENVKQSSLHVPSPLVSDHLSKTLKFSQSKTGTSRKRPPLVSDPDNILGWRF